MAVRRTIYVPDHLATKMKERPELNYSKIFQRALIPIFSNDPVEKEALYHELQQIISLVGLPTVLRWLAEMETL